MKLIAHCARVRAALAATLSLVIPPVARNSIETAAHCRAAYRWHRCRRESSMADVRGRRLLADFVEKQASFSLVLSPS
jgi:hypothetical protein